MKTPFALLAASLALPLFAFAEDTVSSAPPQIGQVPVGDAAIKGQENNPLYRLTSGALMLFKGAEATRVEKPVLFQDGTTLTPGGTLRRADGTSTQLLDGQTVTMSGHLNPAPPNPDATSPLPGAPGGSAAPVPPLTPADPIRVPVPPQ